MHTWRFDLETVKMQADGVKVLPNGDVAGSPSAHSDCQKSKQLKRSNQLFRFLEFKLLSLGSMWPSKDFGSPMLA